MITRETLGQILSLCDKYYEDGYMLVDALVKLDIQTADVRATATAQQCDHAKALLIEVVYRQLQALEKGEPLKPVIDPTWIKQQVVRIEHYLSSNGNPTWKCALASGATLFIRQTTKQMWLDAGYGDLMKMQLGDQWGADIVCYTLPGENQFLSCKQVVAGGKLIKPLVLNERQRKVAEWAGDMLRHGGVIFDTETTGLGDEDEIVQIAVVDMNEKILYETFVKPVQPELLLVKGKNGQCAVDIHHITPEMLADKPGMRDVQKDLRLVMGGERWLGYNVAYDERLLRQSQKKAMIAEADFITQATPTFAERCVMLKYAEFVGETGWQKGSYRWWTLEEACKAMTVPTGDLEPHTAAGDAIATLRLLKALAALDDRAPF